MSPDYLLKQAEKLLQEAEAKYQRVDPVRCIVLYDPATHEPLPGYEPDPRAPAHLWLPKKNEPPGGPYKA